MMRKLKIEIKKSKRDRCARNVIADIGGKPLLFPAFCATISSENELQLLIQSLGIYKLDHIKMLIMHLPNAEKIKEIIDASRNKQLTLGDEKTANQYEIDFVNNVIKIFDPCTEYTFYEERTKELSKNRLIQKDLKTIFIKMQALRKKKISGKLSKQDYDAEIKNMHEKFWKRVNSDDKLRFRLVSDTFNQETRCGAEVGMPPVPLTYNIELLNITKEINRTGRIIWNDDNCATYLLLQSTVFNSEKLVDEIIKYIEEVPTKFIIIKIKNLEIDVRDKIEQRAEFKKLLKCINDTKRKYKEDRIFMLLEAGHQFYPTAASGFDIVSTSLRGIDKDFSYFGKHKGLGGMLDIHTLTIRNPDEVKKMVINKTWRCKCEVCVNLTEDDFGKKNWNDLRKVHYLLAMNNLLVELAQFIEDQKIELAREKVKDSAISNLKQIFPLDEYSLKKSQITR